MAVVVLCLFACLNSFDISQIPWLVIKSLLHTLFYSFVMQLFLQVPFEMPSINLIKGALYIALLVRSKGSACSLF